jgi:hypothetical protein
VIWVSPSLKRRLAIVDPPDAVAQEGPDGLEEVGPTDLLPLRERVGEESDRQLVDGGDTHGQCGRGSALKATDF